MSAPMNIKKLMNECLFPVVELDDTLPRLTDVHWDSVYATHGLFGEIFVWNTALGRGRTWLDSLIVIVKGGHS
jgi:hypothetical protein